MKTYQIYENTTIEEAVNRLSGLRRWAPYRFSGEWFLVSMGNDTGCYRTRRAAERNAAKWGQTTISAVTI